MRRNESGMTLVELVVILAIIAIMAAVGYISVGGILEATKAKGASEQLAGAIRVARQYAITRGKLHCVEIFPSGTGSAYRIRQAAGPPYTCDGEVVEPQADLAHGQAMVTPTNQVIVFDPLGTVKNFLPANPTVTLTVDVQTPPCTAPNAAPVDVFVSLYGGVRVTSHTC